MNDLSEKEQLEAIRTWWADNGNYVIAGVIIGIVTIFGWNRWQATVANAEIEASTLYEDVMTATGRSNLDAALVAANRLYDEYADTAYAAQARLAMARLYMDTGRDQDAADNLRELIDSNPEQEIALVARLRLAKILLYQDRAQEVVDLVTGYNETAFAPRFNEVLGDAHVALGNYAEALTAYTAALNDNPAAPTVDPRLVQLKINDLPLLTEVAQQEAPGAGREPTADSEAAVEPEDPAAPDSPDQSVDPQSEGEAAESPTGEGENNR